MTYFFNFFFNLLSLFPITLPPKYESYYYFIKKTYFIHMSTIFNSIFIIYVHNSRFFYIKVAEEVILTQRGIEKNSLSMLRLTPVNVI